MFLVRASLLCLIIASLRTFFLAFMKSPMMDLEEPIEFIVKDPTWCFDRSWVVVCGGVGQRLSCRSAGGGSNLVIHSITGHRSTNRSA